MILQERRRSGSDDRRGSERRTGMFLPLLFHTLHLTLLLHDLCDFDGPPLSFCALSPFFRPLAQSCHGVDRLLGRVTSASRPPTSPPYRELHVQRGLWCTEGAIMLDLWVGRGRDMYSSCHFPNHDLTNSGTDFLPVDDGVGSAVLDLRHPAYYKWVSAGLSLVLATVQTSRAETYHDQGGSTTHPRVGHPFRSQMMLFRSVREGERPGSMSLAWRTQVCFLFSTSVNDRCTYCTTSGTEGLKTGEPRHL
ncbi:hypothetical protein B0H66DRAFT_329882 [Apodospora peruviana]|uniref:Uncharacterized protein n=1 Tax=Apodospora peruviana TaxID=516989 RepID=A0AAE0HY46_9PEZI|nr:hypothetical protein B0H66DRAFT_329882 [Apodospora peruviana]